MLDPMFDDRQRFVNVFGQREQECAAMKILDVCWETPFAQIDPTIFADDLERAGFEYLQMNGWLVNVNGIFATREFWKRVHGR